MSDEIKVSVVEFGTRPFYMLRWTDPMTGRVKTQSSKVKRGDAKQRKKAQQAAGALKEKLEAGTYHAPSKITWEAFRKRYQNEVLDGLKASTASKVDGIFNGLEDVLNPKRLTDLTEQRLSHYQRVLREQGRSEHTIKSYLAHVGAALNWAVRMKMMAKAPRIDRPKRAKDSKLMKGRPIAGEEFDRLLAAVPKVLASRTRGKHPLSASPEVVESWRHFLRGLWLSGLRLSEALDLWWDSDTGLSVDLTGNRPMLRIPGDCQKSGQDQLLPMAPEFAEFLLAIPDADRHGRVFRPIARRRHRETLEWQVVSRVICRFGEAAGIKVSTKTRTDRKTGKTVEVVKFASAHDLRRSFGERWATKVMPVVLQALMRHASIDTTLKYYATRNAQSMADVLWAAHAATSGNGGHSGNEFGSAGRFGADGADEGQDVTLDSERL